MEATGDFGLIGLAVMGQNLVLNMNDHGFTVIVFNRTVSKVDAFLENEAKGTKVQGAYSVQELCAKLKRPRRVMMLVKAGSAVDDFIELILPHLEPGDIIIDGGNSLYVDTERRTKYVESKGFLFSGCGVSGGEEGARYGPSLMPGGSTAAWEPLQPIFQAIAAKADGEACCDWVGNGGAGHYVKMVHNGIEYGDMQLICEAYALLKDVGGLSAEQIASTFKTWNTGELDSYLIEITGNILAYKDEDGSPLVEKILDKAGQKGTGKWTVESSLDNAVPVTLIAEAVFARMLSSMKDDRVAASTQLPGPSAKPALVGADLDAFVENVRLALYASKICSYAQGYMLLREAAKAHNWELNLPAIALMWRGGCIIRSKFLGNIRDAFKKNPALPNLLLDDFFKSAVTKCNDGWRQAVSTAVLYGVPVPTFSTALAFYDGYRAASLSANLLQAQRDYFGAHTYERVDKPRGEWFHTNWTGTGGNVTSNQYNA
mmetsp:Transcript_5791/g.10244  ORF Transcript_5791/g.10244 Transcript_5791/m.10244 type:complete len:487 (-) Transcript_5791:213-1673(-)|eukprot:CAMPEP_0182449428 /NCGR_PEP_ID=MMETSP1172-20130603/34296_1 /TAXON_ID=708627 /ORGANISM="Timspurckia oligopyrenoides, Strain CCMP3278" /LENGTH=486 /DNA_ID=CAMNT_0024646701 /DNA_START=86 /DNA_END=1546 /DNA_ORIENTATION=+